MTSIRKSLLLASISRYTVNLLTLISIIVTARLLTPEELGTYAIASAFVLFASEFKSLGAGAYLIRIKDLKEHSIRKATGLMVVIDWGMGFLILSVSGEIGRFYQLDDIALLLKLLTFSFFLAPFISIPTALFTRNFEFKKLLIINIITQLFLVFFTITFILLGYSYFSLAFGAMISNVVELGLVLYFRNTSIPLLPTFRGLAEIAKFGMLITFAKVLKRLSLSSTDLLIGKLGSSTDVAIFSRGMGLLEFLANTLQQSVKPVVLPYLSKEIREQQDIEHSYIRATALLGSIVWPTLTVAGVASYPIIIFLFGDQWSDSAPLARILCVWAFFRSIHAFSDDLLVATKNEKHFLIREFLFFVLTVLAIGTSHRFGLDFVALSISIVSILYFLYTSFLLNQLVGIGYIPFVKKTFPIFLLVGIIGVEMLVIDVLVGFSTQTPVISLSILSPIVITTWLIGIKVLNLDIYQEIYRGIQKVFPGR